jgi:high-affinity K+ transport system ATPase subunit B
VKGRSGFNVDALSAAAAAAGIGVNEFQTDATPGDRLDVRVREVRS